jgi:FkbM family methyltransferase
VSRIYIRLIRLGFYKKKYAELHHIRKIVQPGHTVMDIGANLGYYSFFMARCAGTAGKLIAVEPIPLFCEIWRKNLRKIPEHQRTLVNCALGTETKEKVRMTIPVVNGIVRHGLTRIQENPTAEMSELSFDVEMRTGDGILQELKIQRLDFVKCDVEGFERYVIPSLSMAIEKFRPMFQIELSGKENRAEVVDFLLKKGYSIFLLTAHGLSTIQKSDIFTINQDFYFIHEIELSTRKNLIVSGIDAK